MVHWNRHRQDNAIRILEALWHDRRGTRTQLARDLNLDRSTVGTIVDHLIEWNLLYEIDEPVSEMGTGRPAMQLGMRENYGYSIGVEVTAALIEVAAVDLFGQVITRLRVKREQQESTYLTDEIAASIHDTVSKIDTKRYGSLLGVAIGVGGIVDSASGTVLASRNLQVTQPLALGPALEAVLPVPVRIYNDADACAIGEFEYGNHATSPLGPPDDILFVLVRYQADARKLNAGLGIILDSHLRESHSGAGREFRSPFVSTDSTEQFMVAEHLRNGDISGNEQLAQDFSEELGSSVAFLVHALDLRHVILGGDVLKEPFDVAIFQDRLRHHVSTGTASFASQPLALRTPTHPGDSVPWGAASAVIRRLFEERRFPVNRAAERKKANVRTPLAP